MTGKRADTGEPRHLLVSNAVSNFSTLNRWRSLMPAPFTGPQGHKRYIVRHADKDKVSYYDRLSTVSCATGTNLLQIWNTLR